MENVDLAAMNWLGLTPPFSSLMDAKRYVGREEGPPFSFDGGFPENRLGDSGR